MRSARLWSTRTTRETKPLSFSLENRTLHAIGLKRGVGDADALGVDEFLWQADNLREGAAVVIVFYSDSNPGTVAASIESSEPLVLRSSDPSASLLFEDQRVIIISDQNEKMLKAEAQIDSCGSFGDGWRIGINSARWEQIDRRKHPRFEAQVPVMVRTVQDTAEGPMVQGILAHTTDLSIGGAWVRSEYHVSKGSLVELQVELGPEGHARVLGIVTRSCPKRGGFSVEFLDYVGSSRYTLHNYLRHAA
jgi:hypothetical protein